MRALRLALIGGLIIVLSACRVDIKLDVAADRDGSGRLTVTTDIDNEAATLVPGLAEDLRLDDLLQSGWKVEGPTQVNNGGLRVVLTYDFESPAEANRALAQINGPNGPLLAPALKRTVEGKTVATTFDASLQFVGGIEAFSDEQLSSLIGGAPWQATADKLGVDPMQSVSFTLEAQLPGEIRKTTGTEAEGGVIWSAPLDGSPQTVVLGTYESTVDGGVWGVVAKVLGVLLGAWLLVMGTLILLVMYARRRKGVTRREPRRPSRPAAPKE